MIQTKLESIFVQVEAALSDFFGIDYYSTDENLKLDHVALTDFRAGAMENWGLIKYRCVLTYKTNSTERDAAFSNTKVQIKISIAYLEAV